jgi:hypothetical protein
VQTSTVAVLARRKHPRVVEDDEIVRPQQVGEIAEHAIFEDSGVAAQMKHARRGAVG